MTVVSFYDSCFVFGISFPFLLFCFLSLPSSGEGYPRPDSEGDVHVSY